MRLDFGTLAFGHSITNKTSTPNWATSLGQGKDYKINENPSVDEILKGMVYCSVPLSTISMKIGKGGHLVRGDVADSPVVIAAVFSKVYINGVQIKDGKFVLVVTRDTSASHAGRLRLKYGPSNTFNDGDIYTNQLFFKKVREQFSLSEDACWFVSSLNVYNQDELHLSATVIDENNSVEYPSIEAMHEAWDKFLDSDESAEFNSEEPTYEGEGTNIILYGVPGCGKSHTIKRDFCDNPRYMERVVFHPDYTYSDFIGQILPIIEKVDGEEKISYKFTPGPFTKILKEATDDKDGKMYFLVIEEINRGNAPAIFGEVFQLLDRKNGESEYGITNFDIADYVYDDKEHEIKIPKNLTILATMNTADQNVFTLDTAFKRRWIMRSIKNDIEKCSHAPEFIAGTNVTWYSFAKKVNDLIIDLNEGNLSSEDNRLGAYFVKSEDLQSRKAFGEKVLMYLWNDAFKYNRDEIFDKAYKTLEDLLDAFEKDGFVVFNSNVKFDEGTLDKNSVIEVSEYLANKKPHLVALYEKTKELIEERIPNTYIYTTPSKQYIGFGSADNKKKSFAEVIIKTDSLSFELEKPRAIELQELGSEIEYNGSHDHYFKITITSEDELTALIEAIVDSYEQLKG